jgi:hypothetical protein
MKILILIAGIIGFAFSKILLYIYDKICYHMLIFVIKNGNERMQQEISKILI